MRADPDADEPSLRYADHLASRGERPCLSAGAARSVSSRQDRKVVLLHELGEDLRQATAFPRGGLSIWLARVGHIARGVSDDARWIRAR